MDTMRKIAKIFSYVTQTMRHLVAMTYDLVVLIGKDVNFNIAIM